MINNPYLYIFIIFIHCYLRRWFSFYDTGIILIKGPCREMATSFTALRSNWPFNCLMKGTKHGEKALATIPEL